ncbi:MAG: hypothetical protein ACTHP8_10375 [Bosea sp. (in: a-proteobacteria)]|uniref:hypothetical protein n=1 Tax=Bosea sp. (in: a-proteobacteria) TaxID=1871050 RepID=UPI003F7B808B
MKRTSDLSAEWPLQSGVTLGSSVRAKGIERELRRKLPWALRKFLKVEAGAVVLQMPTASREDFEDAAATITQAMGGLAELPVLPSEAEDILSMSSRERHKWMGDGRLQSAGTRTVKLRGRSKPVTFHVFEPAHIEHILNGDLTEIWREEDAAALAENRRRAAGKAALTRAGKRQAKSKGAAPESSETHDIQLEGWEEFAADGLLR